jgi:hypothetical protein
MKMMRKIAKLSAVAVCAAGLTGFQLWAGSSQPMVHEKGTISSIEPTSETLHLMDAKNNSVAIQWDHSTRFFEKGKTISSVDLKKGEEVRAACRKQGDHLIAQTVRVGPTNNGSRHKGKQAS